MKAKEAGKPDEACAKFRASLREESQRGRHDPQRRAVRRAGGQDRLGAQAVRRGRGSRDGAEPRRASPGRQGAQGQARRRCPARDGRVHRSLAPETKLVVAGDVVDPASAKDIEVDPGPVKVVASAPGRVPYEYTVTMHKGETGTITVPKLGYPIEDKGRATLGKVVTFAGAGVVLTGIGVGLFANHKYNGEFDNGHCSMPDAVASDLQPDRLCDDAQREDARLGRHRRRRRRPRRGGRRRRAVDHGAASRSVRARSRSCRASRRTRRASSRSAASELIY